jgi:hypothetical protein
VSPLCVFDPVKSSSHKILNVADGVALFAKVGVEASPSPEGLQISIAPSAFEDPKEVLIKGHF